MEDNGRLLRRASKIAKQHTRKTGTPCSARVVKNRQGEAAIVYDVQHVSGRRFPLFDINEIPFSHAR